MPGRKPTPTALKILKGNPGKRRLPENEPDPHGEVKKPPFVKGKAGKLWKLRAPELERLGLLKSVDVEMFGACCCLMAEFQESPRSFNAARLTQMRALATSFGIDPSARAGMGTPTPMGKKNDTAEKYFGPR